MSKPGHRLREAEIRENVQEKLPQRKEVGLRCFEVTSGDSGNKYWVQRIEMPPHTVIGTCQCPVGYFNSPLSITGLLPFYEICKHCESVAEAISQKIV